MEKKKARKPALTTREIAVSALLLALILIFILVPIPTNVVDLAVIPLLAVFVACQAEGGKIGIIMGALFGVASLIGAFTRPNLLSPAFYNPLVSVIPRVFVGIATYFSYAGMRKVTSKALVKKHDKKTAKRLSILLSSAVSSAVGVITNTGLVLSMIALFNYGKMFGDVVIGTALFAGILLTNFLPELAIAIVITPGIVLSLRAALKKKEYEDGALEAEEIKEQSAEEIGEE
ncbi:MAG: ECF transporter S component [Clostridiales bacterium]|nr:ECF transporter S component [Clostridiales bacterium]